MVLPFLAPIIGALGSAGTAAIGAAGISAAGGLLGNYMSARQASKNRDFQEHMSNTSYQRSMADMKAAGLNPILAYQKGGASTPAGAMANMTNPFKDIPAAVSSAIQLKQLDTTLANIESQTKLNAEKINTEKANQAQALSNSALAAERINSEIATQKYTYARTETEKVNADVAGVVFDNKIIEGRLALYNLSPAEKNAVVSDIQTRLYRTGLGETLVFLREMGVEKPSELVDWALKGVGGKIKNALKGKNPLKNPALKGFTPKVF